MICTMSHTNYFINIGRAFICYQADYCSFSPTEITFTSLRQSLEDNRSFLQLRRFADKSRISKKSRNHLQGVPLRLFKKKQMDLSVLLS